jgi:Mor family transcriptional regulator
VTAPPLYYKNPPRHTERDAAIFAAWQRGTTIEALALEYHIGEARIYTIIKRQRAARARANPLPPAPA